MKSLNILPAMLAGLLVALTYLMVQGATPDALQHERALEAIRLTHFYNAALHRDLLRARAGLLRHYDDIVEDVRGLRSAAETLQASPAHVGGAAVAQTRQSADRLSAAIGEQETLVETFKSSNALLQNSVSYFSHIIQGVDGTLDGNSTARGGTGSLGNAMLRFIAEPRDENAEEVRKALDRLPRPRQSGSTGERAQALDAHAAIILSRLPEVDQLARRLLGPNIDEIARALQETYLRGYSRAAARAGSFRLLLYVASVFLVAYLGYLFVRLRRNASTLRARLSFEKVIASISTQFINLPRPQLGDGIEKALAQLSQQLSADRARIILCDDRYAQGEYRWERRGLPADPSDRELALSMALSWDAADYARLACIHVPDVSKLAHGEAKSFLEVRHIKSWLCVPLWRSGERLGFLTFDAVRHKRHWPDDDVALLRTAGEIFANALERDRTETERESLEARLHQGQRLEAIGTLAGGIAHEFNNILGAILGYAEVAMGALARGSRPWRHVEQVMRAGQRAQGVVDQILAFGRRGDRQHRPMRVQPVIEEALEFLRFSLPATVELRTRLEAGDALVRGDRTQLQQVLINLCTNAAQSIEGRGRLDVALDTMSATSERALSHGNLAPGRYARLSVRDTGRGIDAVTMDRIFEPFFTTKPVGSGTGLGLSMVHGLVAQHGGSLNVRSRPGEGSTFDAYFPQTSDAVMDGDEPSTALVRGDGETVLIVDDEKPLVQLGEEMLAALGYEPVGFDDGLAAIAAFQREPQRFDLVLTDEIMPTITGTELAKSVQEIRPDVPIVMMTGYGGPLPMHRVRAAGVREVLKKPLLSAEIAECLARNLRGNRARDIAAQVAAH
jgi:signal transduction histidine kinase/ActR/RegA family two-component response regulator